MLSRRSALVSTALLPQLVACEPNREDKAYANATVSQKRFKGLGAILVVSAVPGEVMYGIEMFADDSEIPFYTSSIMRSRGEDIMGYPGGILVPMEVRVIWHDSSTIIGRAGNSGGTTYDGKVLGDYKLPIAPRIPDSFIAALRKERGGLRLKFRLHPEGVLFGWDMQLRGARLMHEMAQGDFAEAPLIYHPDGKITRGKGWYIHPKTGQRIETDF